MQNYDIKKGHWKNIEGDRLVQLIKEIFGNASVKGDAVVTSYKAIKKLTVRTKGKTVITLETEMNPDVSDVDATDTISKYNDFLFKVTGFTSKQRRQKLNKKIKDGKL
ncbi:MAG TPA: hypothetical protein ENN76_03020 [Euryarchaeota archaeon]|nr:hypothetical protein [Euryarchaeota archaeon]